jgi:endonuclease-3
MSNLTKSESIQRILNDLYPNPPAPLNHHSDFTFLVAVILSAQTTDGGVNIATKDLFRLAPDAQCKLQKINLNYFIIDNCIF